MKTFLDSKKEIIMLFRVWWNLSRHPWGRGWYADDVTCLILSSFMTFLSSWLAIFDPLSVWISIGNPTFAKKLSRCLTTVFAFIFFTGKVFGYLVVGTMIVIIFITSYGIRQGSYTVHDWFFGGLQGNRNRLYRGIWNGVIGSPHTLTDMTGFNIFRHILFQSWPKEVTQQFSIIFLCPKWPAGPSLMLYKHTHHNLVNLGPVFPMCEMWWSENLIRTSSW